MNLSFAFPCILHFLNLGRQRAFMNMWDMWGWMSERWLGAHHDIRIQPPHVTCYLYHEGPNPYFLFGLGRLRTAAGQWRGSDWDDGNSAALILWGVSGDYPIVDAISLEQGWKPIPVLGGQANKCVPSNVQPEVSGNLESVAVLWPTLDLSWGWSGCNTPRRLTRYIMIISLNLED